MENIKTQYEYWNRSKISGAAIDSLREIFLALKNSTNFERFLTQTVDTLVKRLLVEGAKENVFISEKCDKCFQTIVEGWYAYCDDI